MVAAYPSFATPEQYAALTGTTPPPENIQDLLDSASAMIRRYCGWHVSPVITEDIQIDGNGGTVLTVPTFRLLDITDLMELWNSTVTYSYSPEEIEWSTNGYLRKRKGGGWTITLRGITATIKHGFETADTQDLAQMVISMAARATVSPFGETQQSVGQVAVRFGSGSSGTSGGVSIYPDQMAALDLYRLFGRP